MQAVKKAIEQDRMTKAERAEVHDALQLLEQLTPREQEVLRYVIAGMLNKQIALKLDIAEKTVKVHRGRIMEKLCVDSSLTWSAWLRKQASNRLIRGE